MADAIEHNSDGRAVRLIELDGLIPYTEGQVIQREQVRKRKAGQCPDTLIILEHAPVITLGRSAERSEILADQDRLKALGVEVCQSERGGKSTYHGPGQLVAYPIIDLRILGLDLSRYVDQMEETIIQTAREFGAHSFRLIGKRGVFCDAGKLGSVGVAVTGGIAFHGLSLNVHPDPEHFGLIVPCGLTDIKPTSLEKLLDHKLSMAQVHHVFTNVFESVFGVKLLRTSLA